MTFHSACARMLRAEAERLGYTRALHDLRRGRLAADAEALPRGARGRHQALPAARGPRPDLRRQEPADRRRDLPASRGGALRGMVGRGLPRSTSGGCSRPNAMDFDDLLVRTVNVLELFEDVRRALPRALPLRPRRRVPGHQPRPVPAAAAARRRAREPDRRRRRRPVDLRLPRRRHPQHPRVRATTSRTPTSSSSSRTTARPRRSSTPPTRSSPTTRGRLGKHLWTDLGEGEKIHVAELDDEHEEARFVAGEIERAARPSTG